MEKAGMNKRYVDSFLTAGKNADSSKAVKTDKSICQKALRTAILTAGGALLMGLLVPAGILFLGISFIWKVMDCLLRKVDKC